MIDSIQWLGHGSFAIGANTPDSPLIYINPWRVTRTDRPADIILVSHDHYDHCSLGDIQKLRAPHTQVIGNEMAAQQIENCTVLRPWQSICINRVNIKAVPAYSPDDLRHCASQGGLGFVISINFYDIYYAGDTQLIPEMNRIHPDIAILPIDGNATMNSDQAAQAAILMGARWVIPCNWGSSINSASRFDAQSLAAALQGKAEAVLLPQIK